ncbi:MAG: RluA family pseudouridine synthase [Candidatus Taylorbacteria bacterium]
MKKISLLDSIGILFEDENYLVINKPAGLVVHSDGKTEQETLTQWILKKYPEMKEVGEPLKIESRFMIHDSRQDSRQENTDDSSPESKFMNHASTLIYRPGIVHRLDKETSGVLLIAKNQEAYLSAKKQFQGREIKKVYNAFIYGEMKEEKGKIERPIGRSKNDFRKWTAQRGARGEMREAVTNYRVIKKSKGFSYVEVSPETGRTHQIRVHFKAINHPVVCDKLYAEGKESALGFTRLALHACSLEFVLMGGKRLKVEAQLPEDFVRALNLLDTMSQERYAIENYIENI